MNLQKEKNVKSPVRDVTNVAVGGLIDDAKAAEYLGVSRQSLANWRCFGRGPKYYRIGSRMIRYSPADLQAFMERGAVGGSGDSAA